MICKWESREERLLRFMKITPKKKLEWLLEINEFIHKGRLQNGVRKNTRKAQQASRPV
jgi:hypothetical protein